MHARGAGEKKKKERENGVIPLGVTPRGWPVLRYSCFQIIYDPQNELPHALCERNATRAPNTYIIKGEGSGERLFVEKKKKKK